MGSHGVPCLKQLGGSFTNWIFNPFMATTANRNSWMNEWMNGFISCWWKIHSWTWSRISQQRPILTKKDTLILYSNLFKKVLQKDKVLLILHEMKQGPKTGHNFCLHLGLALSFTRIKKHKSIINISKSLWLEVRQDQINL